MSDCSEAFKFFCSAVSRVFFVVFPQFNSVFRDFLGFFTFYLVLFRVFLIFETEIHKEKWGITEKNGKKMEKTDREKVVLFFFCFSSGFLSRFSFAAVFRSQLQAVWV